jgi:hypothetical protein
MMKVVEDRLLPRTEICTEQQSLPSSYLDSYIAVMACLHLLSSATIQVLYKVSTGCMEVTRICTPYSVSTSEHPDTADHY